MFPQAQIVQVRRSFVAKDISGVHGNDPTVPLVERELTECTITGMYNFTRQKRGLKQ